MTSSRVPRWLPSATLIFLGTFAVVATVVNVAKGLVDVDGFWHLATGRLIVESGAVPSVDPFTFTWAGQPWTPHEWLSEVGMYLLWTTGGPAVTLWVLGVVPALIFVPLVTSLRRQGIRLTAVAWPTCLCALVLVPYVTFRPQSVSWFLLSLLLVGLMALRPDRRRWLMLAFPLFLLWANLHGFYVAGLGVLAVYAAFTVTGRTPMAPAWRWVVGGLLLALLATMLTPAGPVGLLYPLRYLEPGDWGMANIPEWQSPDFHEVAHWPLLALVVAVGLLGRGAGPGWLALLAWLGMAGSLVSLRAAPVAAVLALPTLAFAIEQRLAARHASARQAPASPLGRRLAELAVAAVVALTAVTVALPPDLEEAVSDDIDSRFPVAATAWLADHQPDARVYNAYSWGGWLIFQLTDAGLRNFVDGRNDMFSQQILDDYSATLDADPGWEDILAGYGAEAILVKPTEALVRGPAQLAGWCEVSRDEVAVLLVPNCRAP